MNYGIWSIIPIAITLAIAFWRKNVFLALLSGIAAATAIIGGATGNFAMVTGSKMGHIRFSGSSRRKGLPSSRLLTAFLPSGINSPRS